jgi:hypothetical protein
VSLIICHKKRNLNGGGNNIWERRKWGMKKINYFFILFVLINLLLTSQAHAAILYGHDNMDLFGGELYQIDTVAQTVTLVGADAARQNSGPDIQLSPDNSTIYMSRAGWLDDANDESLFLIDPATGLHAGTLSLSDFPNTTGYNTDTPTALEFVGSTLYASFHKGGPERYDGILGAIDLNTGEIATIGEMSGMNRPTGGLEYVAGTMYAVSSTNNKDSRLFTINLSTGTATLVGKLTLDGVQKEAATALAYANGTMYTVLTNFRDTNLYSVDLSTGALTLEFDLGVQMNSLTSRSGTPPTILDTEKAKICWHHDDLHVEGKLYLPEGFGMEDLAPAGSAIITFADVEVTDQDVEFEVKGKNNDKWKYKDKKNHNGNIKEYKIDWKGSKFDYRGDDKFHIHTHYIGETETTLCIHTGEISEALMVTIDEMTGMNSPTGGLEYVAGATIAYDEDGIITTSIEYEAQKADNNHVHFILPFRLTPDMTIRVSGALEETIDVADYFDEAHAKFKMVSAFEPGMFPDGWESSQEALDLTLTFGEGENMTSGNGLIDSWEKKDVKHWENK